MNRRLSVPDRLMQPDAIDRVLVDGQSEPPPSDDLGFAIPEPARLSWGRTLAVMLLACAVLASAFVLRWLPMHRARLALAAEVAAQKANVLHVQVVRPRLKSSSHAIVLPGSIQPLQETTIFPRASGYVRKWNYDIGDRVKAGAELAVIDTPELDQQFKQARAQLAQARANLLQARANSQFSKSDLKRFEQLVPAGISSQQELEKGRAQAEVDAANVTVADANIDAQRANIDRMVELKSFARVTAPFDGVITARSIEIGTLLTAGNSSPLYKLTATDPVRVFVQVPQGLAPMVRGELAALVSVREYPGHNFVGKVARAAGSLDAATRTMNTEIRVPNGSGELLTGMYAEVTVNLPTPHQIYELPATVLLNDAAGLRVALVTSDQTLHLLPVVLERDNGPTIEISSGLNGTESVVRLVSAEHVEGRKVAVGPE